MSSVPAGSSTGGSSTGVCITAGGTTAAAAASCSATYESAIASTSTSDGLSSIAVVAGPAATADGPVCLEAAIACLSSSGKKSTNLASILI